MAARSGSRRARKADSRRESSVSPELPDEEACSEGSLRTPGGWPRTGAVEGRGSLGCEAGGLTEMTIGTVIQVCLGMAGLTGSAAAAPVRSERGALTLRSLRGREYARNGWTSATSKESLCNCLIDDFLARRERIRVQDRKKISFHLKRNTYMLHVYYLGIICNFGGHAWCKNRV
jgi:hypothetical protein